MPSLSEIVGSKRPVGQILRSDILYIVRPTEIGNGGPADFSISMEDLLWHLRSQLSVPHYDHSGDDDDLSSDDNSSNGPSGFVTQTEFAEIVDAGSTQHGSIPASINALTSVRSDVAGIFGITAGVDGSCPTAISYDDAVAFALSVGARLPTFSEVVAGGVSVTGCGFDTQRIWTQTAGTIEGTRITCLGLNGSTPESSLESSVANVRVVYDAAELLPAS